MSSKVDVITDKKKSIHRTEEGEYEKKNLHSLVLIKSEEEVSRCNKRDRLAQPVWFNWLSVPCTKRSLVQFLVRAYTQVVGSIPSRTHAGDN